MVYQWKNGSRFKQDAQAIGEEVASLPERTPPALVAFAKSKKTASHDAFEWSDPRAAQEYRLIQARELLRSLEIIVDKPDDPGEQVAVRAFVHVQTDDGPQYVEIVEALAGEDTRSQVFAEIAKDLSEVQRKAETYRYLSEHLSDVAAGAQRLRELVVQA